MPGDDPVAIADASVALVNGTDEFASRRMDRSIRAALAGRSVDDVARSQA